LYSGINRGKRVRTQGSIEVKELEKQIDQYLTNIHISEEFKNWAIKYLKEKNKKEVSSRENIFASQRKAYDSCLKKLENLFQLKISPLKTELMKEKARLEEILNDTEGRVEKWLETGEKVFNFARYARYWFKNGSSQEKAQILQALGSNLTLKNKKLIIQLKRPLTAIGQVVAKGSRGKRGVSNLKY